jgi:nucleotide-binding universal stress UspA family protein
MWWSALSAAFGEAERWGCGVVAVHAWQWEDSVTEFGFYPADPHDVFAVEESRRIGLAEAIEPYATAHPGVHVSQVVIPGTVPRALLDAAIDARLLVVSRHKPAPAPRALGSIARRCISDAVCPVMVVAGIRPAEQRVEDPVRAAVE